MPLPRTGLWSYTILCLVIASAAVGQDAGAVQDAWRWTQFTAADGLPSSRVARVLETAGGTAWAVTQSGVAWFDEYAWQRGLGLPAEKPTAVDIRAETLYVACTGSLYRGDTGSFAVVDVDFDRPMTIVGVAVCHAGGLMLEARDRGESRIFRFAAGDVREAAPTHPYKDDLYYTLHAAGGEVFVCHNAGIDRWIDGSWCRVLETKSQPRIGASVATPDGGALVLRAPGNHLGLSVWQGSGPLERREVPTSANLVGVAARGNELLCFDDIGSVHVSLRDVWHPLTSVPVSMGQIEAIALRATGDVWLASARGVHLYLRTSKRWEFHRDGVNTDFDFVHEILHDTHGSLWLATLGGLVHVTSDESEHITEVLGLRLHNLTGLAEDAAGHIWVSSGSGLRGVLRFDGTDWHHFGREDGLEADHIHKIRADRSGGLWFLGIGPADVPTGGPGAFRFANAQFTRISTEEGLPSGRVYDFVEGPDGSRWFATYGGLICWAADGSQRIWRVEGSNNSGEVAFSLAVDESDVWIASRAFGLGRVVGDTIQFLTHADGLSSNKVWNVDIGTGGDLWIATEQGLDLLRDGRIMPVGSRLGLRRLWPLEVHAGRLFVGTIGNGYVSLELGAVSEAELRVTVDHLPDAAVPEVHWQVFAKHGSETPRSIETRYQIGAESWSEWGKSRAVTVSSVAAGANEIVIEARSHDGVGFIASEVQSFTVTAPLIEQAGVQWSLAGLSLLVCVLAGSLWSRRRRHRIELAARETGYRDLFENAHDLIYTLDLDGVFTSANRRAEERLGASRSELIGTRFSELVDVDGRERCEELRREALGGGESGPHEFEIERADGERIWLEISNCPISKTGRIVGTQNFARDITPRRLLEQQLLHAQKMEAVGRLAGGIAHDFNNLLVVIKGFSEMLLTDLPEKAPMRKSLEQIRNAGQRAAQLTRQLLAFSRKEVVRPEALDLSQLLSDMEDLIRRLVGADVEVEVEIDPGELFVFADPSQMEQVVMNLIVNSRDAMPDGGIISIELRETCVRSDHAIHNLTAGDYLCLSITDTGSGMSETVLDRVFEPFFTTKEQGKGTGLGLSTVYGIVHQSGGSIDVRSRLGEGTRFSIYLPKSAEVAEDSTVWKPVERDTVGSETVLLVEDELSVRKFIRTSLEQRGYKLLEAQDGSQAMSIARTHEGPIHILLTDVVMPRMGGPELARRLAAERPDTKVLFMSGYPGNALTRHGLGDEPYLQKPFVIGDLTRKLRELVGKEQRQGQRDTAG